MTLVEILVAMTTTAMISVALAGMMSAVQAARAHTEGLQEATIQGRVAIERIRYMVSQAGVYQLDGEATTLGLAVVNQSWSGQEFPEALVVWSGGRSGGKAAAGLQTVLPKINELVIYTPAPEDSRLFVELVETGDTNTIDFGAAGFANTIRTLIAAGTADRAVLSDRMRVSQLDGGGWSADREAAHVWFGLDVSPGDTELSGVSPETQEWIDLPWAQGIVSSSSGLRQTNVRVELQIARSDYDLAATSPRPPAHPCFGSISYRYEYRP